MATSSVPAGFKLVPDDQEQNQAPEARGKAAALSSYLARKGSPRKGRKLDRAMAKFETMWVAAPDSVKEKYASRSQKTDLAPSERSAPIPRPTNASLNAARPGETSAQASERFRQARTGVNPAAAKAVPVVQAKTPDPAQKPSDQVNIGTPEEQAKVAAMVAEGADFGTATVGNYMDMQSAVGFGKKKNAVDSYKNEKDVAARNEAHSTDSAKQRAAEEQKVDADRASAGMPPINRKPAAATTPPPIPAPGAGPMSAAPAAPATPMAEQPPIAGPSSTLRQPDDFTPGPGKEMVGVVKSRPTYATADSLYGQPKSPIQNTIDTTPATASPSKPVMIQGQTIEQRRGDYQAREAPSATAAMAPAVRPSQMPRGPASQPVQTRSSITPIAPPRANDPDIIAKDNAAQARYQSSLGGGTSDEEHKVAVGGTKAIFDGASSLDQAKLAANSLKRASALPTTVGAPRARIVVPARRPMLAR